MRINQRQTNRSVLIPLQFGKVFHNIQSQNIKIISDNMESCKTVSPKASSTLITTPEQLEDEILEIVKSQFAILEEESMQKIKENLKSDLENEIESLHQNSEQSFVTDDTILDSAVYSVPKGSKLLVFKMCLKCLKDLPSNATQN